MSGIPFNETLTTPSVHQTQAPFPTLVASDKSSDKSKVTYDIQTKPHATEKVEVKVCSELASFSYPFDIFNNAGPSRKETQRKLTLIHDKNGQPVVLAITNTGRLYALFYVNNAINGWQAMDLTPEKEGSSSKVDAFDALELENKVHVVVSLESTVESRLSQIIYHATFDIPNLVANDASAAVMGLPTLEWCPITNGIGDRDITSVLCCPSVASSAGFYICVGTRAHEKFAATHYILDPSSGPDAKWTDLVTSGSAEDLLSLQPVRIGSFTDKKNRQVGIASVCRQTGGNTQQICSVEVLDERTAQRDHTIVLQIGRLGSVNDAFASVTPWGLTDFVLAGQAGIGYYESRELQQLSTEPLLPEISFKQVVCSEVYANPNCHLTIFAISEHDDLYFIEGIRDNKKNKIIFNTPSGIPIRQGVAMMSPQYNKLTNASELLYVSDTNANGLRHLIRDPVSSLWSEDGIAIKTPAGTPSKLAKVPAYMTSLSLTNGNGIPVPQGYSVKVTCEPHVHVSCNGRSFLLNGKPTTISTQDGSGSIDLTLPVDHLLGSCSITVELFEYVQSKSASETITIDPAQRVINGLSSVKSENDLRNARGPTGEVIFKDESKITQAGALLKQFGPMARQISGKPTDPKSELSDNQTIIVQDDGNDKQTETKSNWFDDISETAGHFLGDAIEYLKNEVKTAVKFVVKTVGKALMFVLKIAGKVFSFAMKSAVALLKSVCGILNNIGIDTSGLTKWLALAFNTENAKKTQLVLKDTVVAMFEATEKFLIANKYRVNEWMDDIEDRCKSVLHDPRPPKNTPYQTPSWITSILNNPVVKALMKMNPISWVMEAASEGITEELGDKLVIPSLGAVFDPFAELLGNITEDAMKLLGRLFDSVWKEIGSFTGDPSKFLETLLHIIADLFYTTFDTVKMVVSRLYDVLIATIKALRGLLSSKWVIPGLTDEWEEGKGQEFSLLNCGTFMLAQLLNIVHPFSDSKWELPLDGLQVPNADSIPVSLVETEKLRQLANQPRGPNDVMVMMVSQPQVDCHNLRWQCELTNQIATIVRCIGATIDTFTLGVEVKNQNEFNEAYHRNAEVEHNPRLQPFVRRSGAVIVAPPRPGARHVPGEIEMTTMRWPANPGQQQQPALRLPRQQQRDPRFRRRGAIMVENNNDRQAITKSLETLDSIWKVVTMAVNFTGYACSVLIHDQKDRLPETDKHTAEYICRDANVGLQLGGLILTAIPEFSEAGGIVLQLGSLIEWVGSIITTPDISWWDESKVRGCAYGVLASLTACDPETKGCAAVCSGSDLKYTFIGSIGGIAHMNKTVTDADENAAKVLAEKDAAKSKTP